MEPIVFALTTCVSDYLEIDFKSINKDSYIRISKKNFGILIIIVDMTIIVLYVIFISRLEALQKRYAEQYDHETIEMTDFCF